MNSFSRLLNFFLFALMVTALIGVIIFENKIAKQGIPESVQLPLAPSASSAGVISRATSTKVFVPIKTIGSVASSTRKVVAAPVKTGTTVRVTENTETSTTSAPSISVPGPLVIKKSASSTATLVVPDASSNFALEQSEIIALTNKERAKEGLPPLSFEVHLSSMANAKANDMIQKQYFAHVSPDGIDITQLAKTYDYSYLNIGENLALGDFTSSADVVTGWMNSPGHRANILNKSFTEIGVSAVFGNYQGRNVWYAVQEFGRPLSDCTLPDPVLKKSIETTQTKIDTLQLSLASLEAEMNSGNLDQATYNAKVNEYNALVALYNPLVAAIKKDIQTYNSQVDTYNICAGH